VGTTKIEKRIKVGKKFEVAHELGVEHAPAVLGGFRARLIELRLLEKQLRLRLFYAKSFVNRFHLVLHACVETFDVMFCFAFTGFMGWKLNRAYVSLCKADPPVPASPLHFRP